MATQAVFLRVSRVQSNQGADSFWIVAEARGARAMKIVLSPEQFAMAITGMQIQVDMETPAPLVTSPCPCPCPLDNLACPVCKGIGYIGG